MDTMTCISCKEEKPVSEFYFKNRQTGTRQPYCIACKRVYNRRHYLRHKGAYLERARRSNRARREALRKIILDHLATHPCVDCGEADPVVLEFDHVRGDKDNEVTRMVNAPAEKVLAEIEKCEVRCANCHRRRHARDSMSYRLGV